MSVIYEFELKDKAFKIVRQGAFTKQGNTSQTPGKLDVYELEKQQINMNYVKVRLVQEMRLLKVF